MIKSLFRRALRVFDIYSPFYPYRSPVGTQDLSKTSIITVTYDKDMEFLIYNLKSIKKFCQNYYGNVVVLDDHKNDCHKTQALLDKTGQKYFINKEAKQIYNGYIRQQYIKLYSDFYVPKGTDYICHVDSDNIFNGPHDPSIFFKNKKPILCYLPWNQNSELYWKEPTAKALGFKTLASFMRRMPLIYPTWLFPEFRRYLKKIHGASILDYMSKVYDFSEYEALGGFAYKYYRNEFYWLNTCDQKKEWNNLVKKTPCKQYSNRADAHPTTYVDLSQPNNPIAKILQDE